MSSRARGIRVPEALERDIAREAEERGKSWSSITADLLNEAVRMRRVPGISFVDGMGERRVVMSGTGLEVWEVVAAWKTGGENWASLCEDFSWLAETQLRSALAYYELYPEEVDARLKREERWTVERVRQELPFLVPRARGRG